VKQTKCQPKHLGISSNMLPRDEMQQITAQKSTKGNNMAQQLKTDMWGEG